MEKRLVKIVHDERKTITFSFRGIQTYITTNNAIGLDDYEIKIVRNAGWIVEEVEEETDE